MPDLMKKLPCEIVISIKRLKDIHHEWTVAEFLEAFWNELILRGLNDAGSTKDTASDMQKGRVFSVTNKLCVFCLGEHQSNDFTKVTDIDERRKIVVKYKRCFQCLRKRHQAKKCRDKVACRNCDKTGHHLSICKEATTHRHLSLKGAIAYQTVQAKVNIPGKPEVKCRMLLDTECDRTYIHQSFADKLGGKPVRFERKLLDTVHGDKVHRCAIYNLEVKDLKGVLQCTTEAATLSKLTSVRNVRPKILKERYQHLKDLEFSDVSDEEELDSHVILGLEDLCKLRTGKMVWGSLVSQLQSKPS